MDDLRITRKILSLLQQTSTKEVLQDFLKIKGVPITGTWEDLADKRVIPAVEANQISNDELLGLLRSAEEHGRQHVFLYRAKATDAREQMARPRVKAALRTMGLTALLDTPKVLDQPDTPSIVDVRWNEANVDLSLVIKIVETREAQVPMGEERSPDGKMLTKRYELRPERAVSVARLHRDGLLEVRISARSTGSKKYEQDLSLFWIRVRGLLDFALFRPWPFKDLKERIGKDAAALQPKIRFSNSQLRNEQGAVMEISSRGYAASLYGDTGASSSMAKFLEHDGYCEGSNFFFTQNENLSKDVHVRFAGLPYEFAVVAGCSEEDYEYVLNEVRTLNKRVP